jgi:hypothetical protein
METVYDKIFGAPPTHKQMIRMCQRELDRDCRELQRQAKKMKVQEKVSLLEAKKEARAGNTRNAKAKAKLAARTRAMLDRFAELETNLQGISMQIGMMGAVSAMQKAMKSAVKAMWKMNSQVSLPMMQRIMREFDQQQELMQMKDEMFGEALDDAMGTDELEEDENRIYEEIMDQLAMEQDGLFEGNAPRHRVGVRMPSVATNTSPNETKNE